MDDKQSGHNDISPTKLNSIHHKVVINTDRVERINSTDYNTSYNCEMRLDDDGDDLPFREVISPAESARRRWLFLLCRFPPRSGGVTPSTLLFLGFLDD